MENKIMEILVIDDNAENLELARKQLEAENREITIAHGYAEAIAYLNDPFYEFEMVLTDMMMPAENPKGGALGSYTKKSDNDLVPCGFGLIMTASIHKTVKYIGLVTDANHHKDPAAEWLDQFMYNDHSINGKKVVFKSNKNWEEAYKDLMGIPRW